MDKSKVNGQKKIVFNRNTFFVFVMAVVFFTLSALCWVKKEDDFSVILSLIFHNLFCNGMVFLSPCPDHIIVCFSNFIRQHYMPFVEKSLFLFNIFSTTLINSPASSPTSHSGPLQSSYLALPEYHHLALPANDGK